MLRKDIALKCFSSGFNCCQAVFSAFCEDFGMDTETALKVSSGFGAGMGRMAETCGAVTGAFMAIGLKHGRYLLEDTEGKDKTYALIREFAKRFKDINGSIKCSELLGCDISTPEGAKAARESGVTSTLCPRLVTDAVKILEEMG